jgi:hypothetical protein
MFSKFCSNVPPSPLLHTTLYIYSVRSLSLVRMKVMDSDVLAWVRGKRKLSQVLGAFGLLDFTILRPVLVWCLFETYEPFISLIFQFFQASVNRGYSISGYGGTTVFGFLGTRSSVPVE